MSRVALLVAQDALQGFGNCSKTLAMAFASAAVLTKSTTIPSLTSRQLHHSANIPTACGTFRPCSRTFASSARGLSGPSSAFGAPPVIISPQPCRVVVIGWMGSRKKYLDKYTKLWQMSGDHEVMTLQTTIPMTLLRWRGVVKAGTDIDKVARMHIENPSMPTIYHIFSTGGYIHAGTMWRWMDQVEDHVLRSDLLGEVQGIILDSGPAKVKADMASRAISSAVLGTPASDPSIHNSPLTKAARAGMDVLLQRPSIKLREQEVMEAWHDMAPTCPQLYLYSEADPLVPTSDVEDAMRLQEARGVDVSWHRFKDSGHCEHFRKYPHEYTLQISQFLSRALQNWS